MKNENETKKRIRESALKLFEEKSFEEVTVIDICKASGITKHTFYYYFKSKDDLLEKFYKIPCALSMEEVGAILTTDSYVEQVWMINKKFIDFVKTQGVEILKQIMIKNLMTDQGTFRPNTNEIKELLKLQNSIIEKGKASGQFESRINSRDLTKMFQQLLHSTLFIWVTSDGDFDFEEFVRYEFEILFQVESKYRKIKESPIKYIW
ncbi:MAG: TetR/AcrR family transcriptional regulator [Proteocatella sp.]